jgi:hypothetical protein
MNGQGRALASQFEDPLVERLAIRPVCLREQLGQSLVLIVECKSGRAVVGMALDRFEGFVEGVLRALQFLGAVLPSRGSFYPRQSLLGLLSLC